MIARGVACVLGGVLVCAMLAACSTSRQRTAGIRLSVVAAENIWGDLAAEVGGSQVVVRSVINSPDADPHDYEPTAEDGIAFSDADLVIVNGLGYDAWAVKLAAADRVKGARLLNVGEATGHALGDNPHRWYSPSNVDTMIDALVTKLSALRPALAHTFAANAAAYRGGPFARYRTAVSRLMAHRGTPIGASESIIVPLAQDVGLDVRTPESFLDAISEGAEPTLADKRLCDALITKHEIAVYVYNDQNTTPDVRAQLALARRQHIPIVSISETPTPSGASFVDWQVRQLEALATALGAAT